MNPPQSLDGATLLYWTATTDVPFYYVKDRDEAVPVVAFAIGRFDFSECYQLFTCTREWEVLNDCDALSIEHARSLAQAQAHQHHLIWRRCGNEGT